MKKNILISFVILFLQFNLGWSQDEENLFILNNPVSQEGAISFVLHTNKTYSNGEYEDEFSQTLMELPGLAKCILERSYRAVKISFQWEKDETHMGSYLLVKELPGPEKYHFLFTWDAQRGLSDGYLNGVSFKSENNRYYFPWKVKGIANLTKLPRGPNSLTDVKVLSKYVTKQEAIEQVPEELLGKMTNLIGGKNLQTSQEIRKKRSRILYSSKMNNESGVKDWILEGPGIISFEDDKMVMSSQIPDPPDGATGHFNYWCPVDFPEGFIAEWEYQPISERGISLIFFAAQGENGVDIFDPIVPQRDGHFQPYVNGAIMNYWIVFYSNHRRMRTTNIATTYLNKSSKSSLLSFGDIGISPGSKDWHRFRLIKNGSHIQLFVNDKLCLDYIDPGNKRWGPVLGGGKISFRQMAVTVGAYRNFNVWELK